jgi:SAM-dependent methyltransferase
MFGLSLRLERAQLERCSSCGHAVTRSAPPAVTHDDYGATLRARETYDREYLEARMLSYARGLDAIDLGAGKLLDYGANYGHFVAFALARDWDAWGYEPGKGPRELAVNGADSRLFGDLAQASRYGPFDVVTFWDVLEHLAFPIDSLRKIHSLLRPAGRLLVRVPDARALTTASQQGGRLWGSVYLKLCHPTNPEEHVHHFTPRSLELIGAKAGFVPELMMEATPEERVAAGRTVADGALRRLLHRIGQRLPYEFMLIFTLRR